MACPVGLGVGRLLAHPVASRGTTDRPPRLGGGVYQHGHGVGACRYSQHWHRTPRRSRYTSRLHLVFGRWRAPSPAAPARSIVRGFERGQRSSRFPFKFLGCPDASQSGATTRPTGFALSNVVAERFCQHLRDHVTPFLYLSVDCPAAFWFARERTGPVMVHWAFAQKAHLS